MSGRSRVPLAIVGLLLAVAGVAVGLIITGVLGRLLASAGTGRVQPPADGPIVPADVAAAPSTVGVAAIAAAGVVLALVGVWWLVALAPRSAPTTAFRLHGDPARGTTSLPPTVINSAIERQVRGLPGVTAATVRVRGAVAEPRLSVRVSVDEQADIGTVVGLITSDVAEGLSTAFGSAVDRVAVLVDIDRKPRSATGVAL